MAMAAAAAAAAARTPAMAAARFVQRRLRSSGGKVLGEEEKAAENVYIKKMEQDKLEKLARKGPSPGDQASPTPSSAASDVKTGGGPTESPSVGVSTDENTICDASNCDAVRVVGWYLTAAGWHPVLQKPEKPDEFDWE